MPMSPRRRNETILLAILAILSVVPLRFFVESRGWFLTEMMLLVLLIGIAEMTRTRFALLSSSKRLTNATAFLIGILPILFAVLARQFGSPIAFEISVLSAFGTVSLCIALSATIARTQAMSLVISGFLVLFSTSISDGSRAVGLAILWMTVCVWHLVANHWEKLDLCMPDSVRSTVGLRPASVLLAVALCLLGGFLVRDRFGQSNRLAFGWMPTSGGSKWSDPAARSGIGTGDAAIAAKDHAQSFGAVESEIFLESTESTLFDMFNDMIGEPKKRKSQWERRQAMGSENLIPMHQRTAKSEKGGSSFSTDRMPPKKHHHFDDSVEAAVVQWDGPTGIRLAMERFDTFDGVEWTNSAELTDNTLLRKEIGHHVWFFDRNLESRANRNPDTVSVNLLKVLRLSTTRLPAPMMTAGLHIKDVDRQDFFGIENDGSLFMPGRKKVPPLTVVNLASLKVMEDELIQLTTDHTVSGEGDSRYEQLRSIVEHLRTDFTFDRNATTTSDDPVTEFLHTRRGGDHMFATVAALKAREMGLRSRIVTGFYVRQDAFDLAAGHASVMPNDVHVWTEIQLSDGRWFEIEPTPGYRQPIYTPSMWLVTRRFAAAHAIEAFSIVIACVLLYLTRLIWIEWLLAGGWSLSRLLDRHRQLRIAMQIVEIRARLIGEKRPVGLPQRDWMESIVARDVNLYDRVQQFCDDADSSIFGGSGRIDRRCMSDVVRHLNTRTMKRMIAEVKP